VRAGAAEAHVEARLVGTDDDEVVLARTVPASGRSRAYVDGRMATAGELADRAKGLVDLHGQHAHQALLTPAAQRDALDRFAGSPAADALAAYRAARADIAGIDESLAALGGDARARAREIELLRYQADEIAAAAIVDADEDDRLRAEEERLADADAHRDALDAAYTVVSGAALDAVGSAFAALSGRAGLEQHANRLHAIQAELDDASHDLRTAAEGAIADPERLAAVHARRRVLRELLRKYGATLGEVLAYHDEVAARLAELESYEARAAELEMARAEAEQAADAAAGRLSAARRAAAGDLAAAVEERLRRLAMPRARLEVTVEPGDAGEDGADRVTFLLAANPGEPSRPLGKVASGGELSRAMLALRVALAGRAGRQVGEAVLVFDEVDAGIGGEAGAAVGRELAELAAAGQVLCVTHLAQVAAHADAQLVVRKGETGGRTVAVLEPVEGDARVAELSRMLAGVEASSHARRHAEELLAGAERRR
jgi:DNA repair protein RecN (Recombination protein N)